MRADLSPPYEEGISNNLVASPSPEVFEEDDTMGFGAGGTPEEWAHDYQKPYTPSWD